MLRIQNIKSTGNRTHHLNIYELSTMKRDHLERDRKSEPETQLNPIL